MSKQKQKGNSAKKGYHAPNLIVYGNISTITKVTGSGAISDNPGQDPTKTALKMN